MNLLKEYIRLFIKDEMTEDINMSRLSSPMVGVYAFAQAINKLIYLIIYMTTLQTIWKVVG